MVDFDQIAMREMEIEYPEDIERLDILQVKEKNGTITNEEWIEVCNIDKKLLREFERRKLFYIGNWPFMTRKQKKAIISGVSR